MAQVDVAHLPPLDLRVTRVAYADGGNADRYLLPFIGGREPVDGEGAWTAIVRAMADGAEVRGAAGRFVCFRTDAMDGLLPSARHTAPALDERRLQVEQSNTSIVLGERLILKIYRLLEPGASPDLEVSTFLTDAGFSDTPAVAGAMTYVPDEGEGAAAAMLQEFLPSAGDAWRAMLRWLDGDSQHAVEMAARIGRVTAAMHAALASRPDKPSFPARSATAEDTAAWRASAERQLSQALKAVGGDAHDRLVRLAPAVTARFADTFGSASDRARVSRIHGDFHLGQLLARSNGGFSIIDFEGEPARPLAERRRPGSPLKDVAGLLRSLDYAARTARRKAPSFDADRWLELARAAFVDAYGRDDPSEAGLIDAFELEKACYEVRYEAGNRPDWVGLPLSALERLVGSP